MTALQIMVVAVGGALGSLLRYFLSIWVSGMSKYPDFPLGILSCNVLGSFLVGLFAGMILFKAELSGLWRAFLIIGICGGFTTFSSFSLDTITLLKNGDVMLAFANILLSLLLCLSATYVGLKLMM